MKVSEWKLCCSPQSSCTPAARLGFIQVILTSWLSAGGCLRAEGEERVILTPSQLSVCSAGVQRTLPAHLFDGAYVEAELHMSYSDTVNTEGDI